MTNRERFHAVLNNKMPDDRLPVIEWAMWWRDRTVARWENDFGRELPYGDALFQFLGLDVHRQFWLNAAGPGCPKAPFHGAGILKTAAEYDALFQKKLIYPADRIANIRAQLLECKARQETGELPVWLTFEGFFWHPRTLFGIEAHLFSFYDEPELYHRMCRNLVAWQLKMIDEFCEILTPDFMTIAEDMSYNHGPMLSREAFFEFLAPYYNMLVPELKRRGIKIFVDTDGDVTPLIPWLLEVGVQGILPLERQAGVDIGEIKKQYPELLTLGAFDKTVMKHGEAAMRAEFERLLPAMRMGGFIPSVDHQTPPDVSLENYRVYVKLLTEYCAKAVR